MDITETETDETGGDRAIATLTVVETVTGIGKRIAGIVMIGANGTIPATAQELDERELLILIAQVQLMSGLRLPQRCVPLKFLLWRIFTCYNYRL